MFQLSFKNNSGNLGEIEMEVAWNSLPLGFVMKLQILPNLYSYITGNVLEAEYSLDFQ